MKSIVVFWLWLCSLLAALGILAWSQNLIPLIVWGGFLLCVNLFRMTDKVKNDENRD